MTTLQQRVRSIPTHYTQRQGLPCKRVELRRKYGYLHSTFRNAWKIWMWRNNIGSCVCHVALPCRLVGIGGYSDDGDLSRAVLELSSWCLALSSTTAVAAEKQNAGPWGGIKAVSSLVSQSGCSCKFNEVTRPPSCSLQEIDHLAQTCNRWMIASNHPPRS